ncbi:MepB family protein [Sporosarcina gallistercoris]|uniref:MepB family protein n=1 Tax=Sporosarcina gallistercoris TaxID=2762245 RepID=A0ABR8PJZ4_9BACL|nr:MepB family protein [Sporosarcina gallistercoris]MBD7908507.1 MepB family protein [Sporosarcina gallistercoris]
MNDFQTFLAYVNKHVYQPNHFTINDVQEERQNSEYGAGTFQLGAKSVRFRVAKITPAKKGQFVALWEKDEFNRNQPFPYDTSPDLVVINTFTEHHFGQFIFPKTILASRNILTTTSTNGKMAFRVYPSWDKPTSPQAIATQKWQLDYFVDLSDASDASSHELLSLYSD